MQKLLIYNRILMYIVQCTLQVGHFLTRFAHASQRTECPQGLNVTTAFVLQTKHSEDATVGEHLLHV